jgi:hypothetical protein
MSGPGRLRVVVAAAVLLVATRAAGDPGPVHATVPVTLRAIGSGHELELPPGYYLTEDQWDALDFRVRTLEDESTRLRAENASLRSSAGSGWPGWKVAVGAVLLGVVGGVYVSERWLE